MSAHNATTYSCWIQQDVDAELPAGPRHSFDEEPFLAIRSLIAQQAAQDLKQRQEQALHEQQARSQMMVYSLIIVVVGIFASYIVGNRLSAATAGVAGIAAGVISGVGLITSLLIGLGIFLLLITLSLHL